MTPETSYETNRLIYLSLAYSSGKKRIVTQNSAEMTELVQRFQAKESFRSAVVDALRAMELRLLALEDNGLRLSARNADSFFAATLTDYGRLLARSDLKAADVLPVHCATRGKACWLALGTRGRVALTSGNANSKRLATARIPAQSLRLAPGLRLGVLRRCCHLG